MKTEFFFIQFLNNCVSKMVGDFLFCFCLVLTMKSIQSDEGYFLHVTDFHYDPAYNRTNLSCVKPGQFEDTWCNSPWYIVQGSVNTMEGRGKPDFVLWTGDTVLQAEAGKLNHTLNAQILDDTTELIKSRYPGVPVYPTFGEYDAYPTGQFPPQNTLLYNESYARWRSWINDSTQEESFKKGGFYTVKTTYGLRIIALNTILYYKENRQVQKEGDPAGQFAWLTQTLEDAKKQNEKVIVTGHIAPGVTPKQEMPLFPKQNDRLVVILRNYADVIVAMHFGHEHADAFKVLKNNAGIPTTPVFIAPSAAPHPNPAHREIKYDRVTGTHIDYHVMFHNISEGIEGLWQTLYLTYNAYPFQLSEVTAEKLSKIIEKMKDANSRQFKTYRKNYFVGLQENQLEPCDQKCHAVTWCAFTEFTLTGVDNCVNGMVSKAVQVTSWMFWVSLPVVLRWCIL